eukprot:1136328-Pelagomonas_calceolata.AAC.2
MLRWCCAARSEGHGKQTLASNDHSICRLSTTPAICLTCASFPSVDVGSVLTACLVSSAPMLMRQAAHAMPPFPWLMLGVSSLPA